MSECWKWNSPNAKIGGIGMVRPGCYLTGGEPVQADDVLVRRPLGPLTVLMLKSHKPDRVGPSSCLKVHCTSTGTCKACPGRTDVRLETSSSPGNHVQARFQALVRLSRHCTGCTLPMLDWAIVSRQTEPAERVLVRLCSYGVCAAAQPRLAIQVQD